MGTYTSTRDEVDALVARNPIFVAGGEFLARHFHHQESERGVPADGYGRRPPIGLKFAVGNDRMLACKPGWTPGRVDRRGRVPVVRVPCQVHIDRSQLELVTTQVVLRLAVTEDGARLGRCAVYRDYAMKVENVKAVAQPVHDLIAAPMATLQGAKRQLLLLRQAPDRHHHRPRLHPLLLARRGGGEARPRKVPKPGRRVVDGVTRGPVRPPADGPCVPRRTLCIRDHSGVDAVISDICFDASDQLTEWQRDRPEWYARLSLEVGKVRFVLDCLRL